jgi:hypothetical protein
MNVLDVYVSLAKRRLDAAVASTRIFRTRPRLVDRQKEYHAAVDLQLASLICNVNLWNVIVENYKSLERFAVGEKLCIVNRKT